MRFSFRSWRIPTRYWAGRRATQFPVLVTGHGHTPMGGVTSGGSRSLLDLSGSRSTNHWTQFQRGCSRRVSTEYSAFEASLQDFELERPDRPKQRNCLSAAVHLIGLSNALLHQLLHSRTVAFDVGCVLIEDVSEALRGEAGHFVECPPPGSLVRVSPIRKL